MRGKPCACTLNQLCIQQLVRASQRCVNNKDLEAVTAALRRIFHPARGDEAVAELDA